ncbi:hypothetical protein BEL07_18870 [Mycolicibacterium grossiae]|uniref:DUF732 domain-containing protein n=1 Tax=Mycolicibacterium grossiae TaxID=1552759 RepID=A0A1E8Q156_9MYCO|nr:hypothetical protein [Mycolicibacterium grossiae]OFJ52146.1 hypothetical protein BEL07_18870 [Mycolicibacterium grossiae]
MKHKSATAGAGLLFLAVFALAPAVAHAEPDYDGAANVACQYSLAYDAVYPNPLFLVDYHGFPYEEARRFVIDAFRSAHERNGGYIAPEMQRDTCDGIQLSENY